MRLVGKVRSVIARWFLWPIWILIEIAAVALIVLVFFVGCITLLSSILYVPPLFLI